MSTAGQGDDVGESEASDVGILSAPTSVYAPLEPKEQAANFADLSKQLATLQSQLQATHYCVVSRLQSEIGKLQQENKELRSMGGAGLKQVDSSFAMSDIVSLDSYAPAKPCGTFEATAPVSSPATMAWSAQASLQTNPVHLDGSSPAGWNLNNSAPQKEMPHSTREAQSHSAVKEDSRFSVLGAGPESIDEEDPGCQSIESSAPAEPTSMRSSFSKAKSMHFDAVLRGSKEEAVPPGGLSEVEEDASDHSFASTNALPQDLHAPDADDGITLGDHRESEGHHSQDAADNHDHVLEIAAWLHTKPKLVRQHPMNHQKSSGAESGTASGFFQASSLEGHNSETDSIAPVGSSWFDRLVLHPSSRFVRFWDVLGLVLLLYDLAAVPLDFLRPQQSSFTAVMSWTICFYWTLSIGVSSCTAYVDEDGSVIWKHAIIIQRYAFHWMVPDVLALTFSWIDLAVNDRGAGKINLWVSELRTVRLVRLAWAPAVVGLNPENVRSDRGVLLIGVLKIVSLIVSFAHITACCWYGVGSLNTSYHQGWVEREGLQNDPLAHRYVMSFYWALAAFVGEVVNSPHNILEQGFAAGVILLSFLISANFVSSLTTSMTQMQLVSSQQSANMSALRQYLSEHECSRALAVKLMRNAQHSILENKRRAHESSIELLQSISEPLLAELHFELRGRHLAVHPFLKTYNLINPSGMKKVCHVGVQYFTFTMGDVIFHEFEVPANPRMLFLIQGKLVYRYGRDTESYRLSSGQWSSEASIWVEHWTHLGTLSAVLESQVMALDAQRFARIVHTYPTLHLRVYAKFFIDYMKRMFENRLLTDLCPDEFELAEVVHEAVRTADEETYYGARESTNSQKSSRSKHGSSQHRRSATSNASHHGHLRSSHHSTLGSIFPAVTRPAHSIMMPTRQRTFSIMHIRGAGGNRGSSMAPRNRTSVESNAFAKRWL